MKCSENQTKQIVYCAMTFLPSYAMDVRQKREAQVTDLEIRAIVSSAARRHFHCSALSNN